MAAIELPTQLVDGLPARLTLHYASARDVLPLLSHLLRDKDVRTRTTDSVRRLHTNSETGDLHCSVVVQHSAPTFEMEMEFVWPVADEFCQTAEFRAFLALHLLLNIKRHVYPKVEPWQIERVRKKARSDARRELRATLKGEPAVAADDDGDRNF